MDMGFWITDRTLGTVDSTLEVLTCQKPKMLGPCIKQWITCLQTDPGRVLVDTGLLAVRIGLYLNGGLMTGCHAATFGRFSIVLSRGCLGGLVARFGVHKRCGTRCYSWPSIGI